MANLNLTTIICTLVGILLNTWAHPANGLFIVKPQYTYVLAGKVATLNCSTSSTEGVHWYHGTNYVYAGGNLYSTYKNRLKIEVYQNDGTTAFNLVFQSVKPEDAGTYKCRDIQGRGETSSAEMTVFAADGNGTCVSNMKSDGVVIPNDCNIDPDEVQLSCSVTFYGNYPPQLKWMKVPENGNSVTNTECQTINNRVMCNTSISGDRELNSSSFVCQTTGSSELNVSLCRIPVKNLLYAYNVKTTTKSSVDNEVQCNPETSQTCYYKWKHSDTVISTSRAFTPDRTGLYQCEANCNIRGKRCIVFGYVYISDEGTGTDSISCSTGCFVGICLIILILILVILVLIAFLKKEKGKRFKLLNKSSGEKRDLETKPGKSGTEPEQISLMPSQDKSEAVVDEPKLIRTLIPEDVDKQTKGVFGVAILGDELFIIRIDCPEIEVFGDLQELKPIREVALKNHKLELPWDIQSCSENKCLYIVDERRGEKETAEIIRIDPDGNVQHKWKTKCKDSRLSITYEFNVIITSSDKNKIEEYSPDGELVCLIEWPSSVGIIAPWITFKQRENEYIVSYGDRGDPDHRVCVIDLKGNIKYNFGGKKGSTNYQLNVPVHMAAYFDGRMLVADKDNRRLVLLSPELKFLKSLFSSSEYLRLPNRVCLDEKHKRLFVADNKHVSSLNPWGEGRVFVFDMSGLLQQ